MLVSNGQCELGAVHTEAVALPEQRRARGVAEGEADGSTASNFTSGQLLQHLKEHVLVRHKLRLLHGLIGRLVQPFI